MTQTTAPAARSYVDDSIEAAGAARMALTFLGTYRRNLNEGITPSPRLVEAILRAAGAEAAALRRFDAYAATYARAYVADLLRAGHLDAIEQRFTRSIPAV